MGQPARGGKTQIPFEILRKPTAGPPNNPRWLRGLRGGLVAQWLVALGLEPSSVLSLGLGDEPLRLARPVVGAACRVVLLTRVGHSLTPSPSRCLPVVHTLSLIIMFT
jgi:hypothetical protein